MKNKEVKKPIYPKPLKDHLLTIKTMGDSVKLFENAHKAFFSDPNGENYKDMEDKRTNMFLTCDICFQTSFPETDNFDAKEALRIAKELKQYREHPETLKAL